MLHACYYKCDIGQMYLFKTVRRTAHRVNPQKRGALGIKHEHLRHTDLIFQPMPMMQMFSNKMGGKWGDTAVQTQAREQRCHHY